MACLNDRCYFVVFFFSKIEIAVSLSFSSSDLQFVVNLLVRDLVVRKLSVECSVWEWSDRAGLLWLLVNKDSRLDRLSSSYLRYHTEIYFISTLKFLHFSRRVWKVEHPNTNEKLKLYDFRNITNLSCSTGTVSSTFK